MNADAAPDAATPDLPRLRVVNTTGAGFHTQVFIDDQDVSSCFNAATITTTLRGPVEVQLNAIICEIEIDNAMSLRMPNEGTRELLIKHGWTPPAEHVVVPAVHKHVPYEPLDHDLMDASTPISGNDLMDRFIERVRSDWTPNEDDSLTVSRVYDEDGDVVAGKFVYTARVTMDSPVPETATS